MVGKIEYYWMQPKEVAINSVAYAPGDYHLSLKFIKEIATVNQLPFSMKLHSISVKDKIVKDGLSDDCLDYLSNNFGCALLSTRLKDIIADNLIGSESVRWISVCIEGKSKTFEYYIPFFTRFLDTLDTEKTIYTPGTKLITKPVFDYTKYSQYAMFHNPGDIYWQMSYSLYVNEKIRKAILSSRMPGFVFEKL